MSGKVFLSQSGPQSRLLAEALAEWLPSVIQSVRPFVSSEDIEKGARWATDIARELQESAVGILCITAENVEAPWIMFEAGALSKTVDQSRVVPYLFDMDPASLKGPLVQFQAARTNQEDTRRLVQMINRTLVEARLTDAQLDRAFDVWWPELNRKLESIRTQPTSTPVKPFRSTSDMLDEILGLTRTLVKRDVARRAGSNSPALNHGLFVRLKQVLDIPYRVYFLDRSEMNAWLDARQFRPVEENKWEDPGIAEWAREDDKQRSTLHVNTDVFDENGRVRFSIPEWNDGWVAVSTGSKTPAKATKAGALDEFPEALDGKDDDLPF